MRYFEANLVPVLALVCLLAVSGASAAERYAIVIGSFSELDRAELALKQFRKHSNEPLSIYEFMSGQRTLFRLTAGRFDKRAAADAALHVIRQTVPDAWVDIKLMADTEAVPEITESPAAPSPPPAPEQQPKKITTESTAPVKVVTPPEPPVTRTVVVGSKSVKKKKKSGAAAVPPGFESLLEPQTTEVDVYFGSSFLTATLATYTPTEITLLIPDEVVARLSDLLEPERIVELLSGPMPTNAELVCLYENQTACGELETDLVEVIFDENRFRLDLFFGPSLLAVRDTGIDKFLPRSSGGLAFLNQINATMNGRESGSTNYNVGNSTTLAYKEMRLLALSNVTDEDSFSVDTLAVEREVSGRLYQAGYFRSSAANLVFLTEVDYAGLSVSSSLDTRTDLDQSTGSDLQVFLDSRSRVDVLKDGRLISTGIYDAGNQIVNTTSLPGGAYDIVLRIRDSFGRTSEETRFYVKTSQLPPLDHTLYFLDVGEVAIREDGSTLPTRTGDRLLRAGLSKRLTRGFGGQMGVMVQDDESLYEIGLFQLGRSHELNLSMGGGDGGDRGLSFNGRFRYGQLTLNANLRKTWVDSDRALVSLFGSGTAQGSLNVSMPIGRGTLSLTGRYNERIDGEADKNFGFRYDFPSYTRGFSSIDTDLQVTRDNGDIQALLTFRFKMDRGQWRNEISSQYYYDKLEDQPSDEGFVNRVATAWQDGDRFRTDVNWSMRAVNERDDDTVETDLEVVSDYGRFNSDLLYAGDSGELSWGASLHTNIIANSNTISFGGREQARSALVMDVEGQVEDAYFDVLVNGSPRGNARIGAKTVIGLQPYETYEVSLMPKGGSIVDFNNQVQHATLYPGNVVTMSWQASRVMIAFGQLIRADGTPVTNALIEGVTGIATTDEFGYFQAELESTTSQISARTKAMSCTADLPTLPVEETIVMLEELVCR